MRSILCAASVVGIALGAIQVVSAAPAALFIPENHETISGSTLSPIVTYSGSAARRTFEALRSHRLNYVRIEEFNKLIFVQGKQISCAQFNDGEHSCSMLIDKSGRVSTRGWYDIYRADLVNLDPAFDRTGATDQQRIDSAVSSKKQKKGVSVTFTGAAAELLKTQIPATVRSSKAHVLCQNKKSGPSCSFMITKQGTVTQTR